MAISNPKLNIMNELKVMDSDSSEDDYTEDVKTERNSINSFSLAPP